MTSGKFPTGNLGAAKLTAEAVQDIRRRYASGGWTQGRLGREFGVTLAQIGRIVRYEVWQNLTPPTATASEVQSAGQRLVALQSALSESVPVPEALPAAEDILNRMTKEHKP